MKGEEPMKKIWGLLLGMLVWMLGIPVFAQGTEWECENCGEYNAADYNFCGVCGSRRPMEDWECENCGTVNFYEGSNGIEYVYFLKIM